MLGIGESPARPPAEQHGQHRQAQGCESDLERHTGTLESELQREGRIDRDEQVDPVAEEPEIGRDPPERAVVDGELELGQPEDRERYKDDSEAEGPDEESVEEREECGKWSIHAVPSVPPDAGPDLSPRRSSGGRP